MNKKENTKKPVVIQVIYSSVFSGALRIALGCMDIPNTDNYMFVMRNHKGIELDKNKTIISKSSNKWSLRPIWELYLLVRKTKANYLHCHSALKPLLCCLFVKVLMLGRLKIIVHEHGIILGSEQAKPTELKLYLELLKLTKSIIYIYIGVSKTIQEKLIELGIKKQKISVIYNFIDPKDFIINESDCTRIKQLQEKFSLAESDFVIGFAARLEPLKGLNEFLEAVKLLSSKYQNMKFLIAGEGTLLNTVKDFISSNSLERQLIYTGSFSLSEIKLFYSLLNCFVVPSYWESFSLTSIEAQLMGVPLVASSTTGILEITKNNENAIWIRPHDSGDLSDKIESIYSDPELRGKLINNGKQNALKYTKGNFLSLLNKLYAI